MIFNNCIENYKFDPQHAYDFSDYINDLSGISIYYGIGPCNTAGDTNFKIKFNVEYPNTLYQCIPCVDLDFESTNTKYDLVFHICPYTCEYLNNRFSTTKYVPTFFPLPDTVIVPKERIYPVFYSGSRFGGFDILDIFDIVSHKYLGQTTASQLKTHISNPHISSYYKKLDIYSQTKIALIHNVLSFDLLKKCPGIDKYLNDVSFSKYFPWHTKGGKYVPQIKSRIFEAAMMGCIPLVYKDGYNLVERYFIENEEFIYFTDYDDLTSKIDMILADYDKYKIIGENAQRKFNEHYTFKHFIDIIKKEYQERKNV